MSPSREEFLEQIILNGKRPDVQINQVKEVVDIGFFELKRLAPRDKCKRSNTRPLLKIVITLQVLLDE